MAQTAMIPLRELNTYLDRAKGKIAEALPKHLTPERLIKVAVTAASRTPALLECTPESFLMAMVEAGQLGLEPNGVMGQAYLIPYYNGKTGRKEVQFQPGYRGLADLVLRAGDVASIDARAVFDGDRFDYEFGLMPRLVHKPSGESDASKMTHVYVIFRMRSGEPKFDVMTRKEVEAIRKRSRAKDSGPWVTDYVEMSKKTVVKRGVKLLRMSPELEAAIEKDNAVETGQAAPLSSIDPSYGDPEEPEVEEVDADAKSKSIEEKLGDGAEPDSSEANTGESGGDVGTTGSAPISAPKARALRQMAQQNGDDEDCTALVEHVAKVYECSVEELPEEHYPGVKEWVKEGLKPSEVSASEELPLA